MFREKCWINSPSTRYVYRASCVLSLLIINYACPYVFPTSAFAQEPAGPTAAWHRKEGIHYLQNREAQKALEHFRAAAQLDAQDAESRFYAGAILVDSGKSEAAISELLQAIALNPGLHLSHYYLALALERTGRQGEAIVEYQEALRLKPDFHDARYALSAVCWKQGDLDGAILLLREITEANPGFAEGHFNLALALKQKGNLDEAVNELQIALKLQPDQPRTYLVLGQTLAEKKKMTEAVQALQRAVELAPADPEYRYNLGIALKQKDELDAAETEFRDALKLNPRYTPARRALGLVLRQKGDLQASIVELRAAVAERPDDAEARHNLGTALFKIDDLGGAISELGQAVRLAPLLSEARINLAQALRKAGNVEQARKELEASQNILTRKTNAGRALVLSESAAQHLKSGDLTKAIERLREATTLDPELFDAQWSLSSALRRASADSGEISKVLGRAIEINPRHAGAHHQLGLEYEKQGKKSEAIAEYRIAVELAPSLIEARRALGKAAIAIKDWELAASQLRALIAWAPRDADAHYQLSVALKAAGRGAEAERELQTARKLNPSHKY